MNNKNDIFMTPTEIADVVKKWFKDNDYSMQKIGAILGISQQVVSYNFYRPRGFRQSFIDMLAEHFNFNPSFLRTGCGDMFIPSKDEEQYLNAVQVFVQNNPKDFETDSEHYPDGLGPINESFACPELFEALYANFQVLKKNCELRKAIAIEDEKCIKSLERIFKALQQDNTSVK